MKDSEIIERNLKDSEIVERNLKDSEIIEQNLKDSEIVEKNLKDSEIIEKNLKSSETAEKNLKNSKFMEKNVKNSEENSRWCCAKIPLMLTSRLYSAFRKNSKVDAEVQPEVCCKNTDNYEEKLKNPNFVLCDCKSICDQNKDQVTKNQDFKVSQTDLSPDPQQQQPLSQKSDPKLIPFDPNDTTDDFIVDLNILEDYTPELFKLHFDNFSNTSFAKNEFDDDCFSFDKKIPTTPCTEEHLRKVSRMKAVRDEECSSDKGSQKSKKETSSGHRALVSTLSSLSSNFSIFISSFQIKSEVFRLEISSQ